MSEVASPAEPEIGLSEPLVQTIVGKPFGHWQQRITYEARRREVARTIRLQLSEMEAQHERLTREIQNLHRWIAWEALRPPGPGKIRKEG